MNRVKSFITLFVVCIFLGQSCRNAPSGDATGNSLTDQDTTTIYHGNLSSPEYDSIVNHLVMFPNETFELSQVDRIAEHHLNEKTHKGIYVYLADSTRLGLYTEDGYLMLQFLLTETGMIPMIVHTDNLVPEATEWKRILPKVSK